MASLNPFGALANVFVPTAQTLGTYQQLNQIEQEQMARKASRERGIDAILADLGPEYEVFRKARAAGMSDDDLVPLIGGDIGKNIRASFVAKKAADIANSPGTYQDKVNRALASGLITADQAMGFLKPPSANSEFDQYRAAHPEMGVDQAVKTFANIHKADPAESTELKPIYNTKDGTVNWTYVPKGGAAGTSVGQQQPRMGASPQAEEATTRVGLQDLSATIGRMKADTSAMPTWTTYAKMKAGLPVDQDSLAMLGQVSVLNTTLTGLVLRSWGSRNPVAAQEIINLHVPKVGDSPKLLKQKIQEWLKPGGYLDQYRQMSGELPASTGEAPADIEEY